VPERACRSRRRAWSPSLDGDVQGIPIGVEDGGRLDPVVHVFYAFFQELVYPYGPFIVSPERRAFSPQESAMRSIIG
jgi:hypothetical protein